MTAFDDAGRPVPTIEIDFEAMDPRPPASTLRADEIRAVRLQTILQLLRMLDHGPNTRTIGRRLAVLAFLVKASECKTQRELARRLRVSPGRVSQALNSAKRDLALLAERL